jgi:hypothetical protein
LSYVEGPTVQNKEAQKLVRQYAVDIGPLSLPAAQSVQDIYAVSFETSDLQPLLMGLGGLYLNSKEFSQ